jgi:hypothetical protein
MDSASGIELPSTTFLEKPTSLRLSLRSTRSPAEAMTGCATNYSASRRMPSARRRRRHRAHQRQPRRPRAAPHRRLSRKRRSREPKSRPLRTKRGRSSKRPRCCFGRTVVFATRCLALGRCLRRAQLHLRGRAGLRPRTSLRAKGTNPGATASALRSSGMLPRFARRNVCSALSKDALFTRRLATNVRSGSGITNLP